MAAAPGAQSSPYFVNRTVDILFAGGISLAIFAFVRLFGLGERTAIAYETAGWLVWVGNWPHFSATSYRLYRSKGLIAQFPLTAVVIPIVMFFSVVASLLSPLRWAPLFIKLFTIWSPYHFSGQTLGITLLYARPSGLWVQSWQRAALSCLIFSTFITESIAGETGISDREFYGIHYPSLNLPFWMLNLSWIVMGIAIVAVLAAFFHWRKNSGRLPLIVVTPVVAQFVWFVVGARYASFLVFVPLFHSLQYLLIAWAIELREARAQPVSAERSRRVARESLRWVVINFVGGACLFYVLPRVLAASTGRTLLFSTGVALAAVQIHHFFVDGVIWKLRAPGSAREMAQGESRAARVLIPAGQSA